MLSQRPTITATVPCQRPPAWAVLERRLFDVLDQSVYPFLAKYTDERGWLRWPERWHDDYQQRDGVDDFYESFVNWPLYYLLGGGDHILTLADRQWDAITAQLSALGRLRDAYERGYDQFHQSEHYPYFYTLCLADPANPKHRDRARRFADMYTRADPAAPNYDSTHRIIRAPMNGSDGPAWGYFPGEPIYPWTWYMAVYGLPYHDVPGIQHYDDLKDPALARLMGEVMQERMGRGDVAANLGVTSLVANAFLLTGEGRYRAWLAEYVGAWVRRAADNGGLIPDNVGLGGKVGEYTGGRWYGGLYGWTWPHGLYNIAYATIVGAAAAFLATGDCSYLELPRWQLDHALAHGGERDVRTLTMSLGHHWHNQLVGIDETQTTFVVPYRYGDQGWFDEQPLSPIFPLALWALTLGEDDRRRVEQLRAREAYDWRAVRSFRTKEDAGHEQPWFCYLSGENPTYPEQILGVALDQVAVRLEQIRQDTRDFGRQENLDSMDLHHWQRMNPITTEALVQLTLGAPAPIYNGGLLISSLRYYDAQRQRPGLPADVAALVERLTDTQVVVQLINLCPFSSRELIVQAGAFAEHRFRTARFDVRTSPYPGAPGSTAYAAPALEIEWSEAVIDGPDVHVVLPPATRITLELQVDRFVAPPSYRQPF